MDNFIGFIYPSGINFTARGFALCYGQHMLISQHQPLFALLGIIYGGDGRTYFALPDLRGRTPIGAEHGAGLTSRKLGERGGVESHTLRTGELPKVDTQISIPEASAPLNASVSVTGSPTVTINVAKEIGNKPSQVGPSVQSPSDGSLLAYAGEAGAPLKSYLEGTPGNGTFNLGGASITLPSMTVDGSVKIPAATVPVSIPGSGSPVSIMQPYLAINYQIALQGIFPSRS